MQDVIGFILGGGRGASLFPLTKYRSVPAVSVGGKYRLIDIPVSNCINSGLRRVFVLTQFLSVSLHRHIAATYKFSPFSRGSVEVLAAQQTNETASWYQGTADALRQNLRTINDHSAQDVLILSADGMYRMNYALMMQGHREHKAALTVAAVPVDRERASRYGILRVDNNARVRSLIEKPTGAALDALRRPDGRWLANMGIYLARRDFLTTLLGTAGNQPDLVTQHFAPALDGHLVRAHVFDGYWQDLGHSIRTYHESQLALAGDHPPFDFNAPDGVIYTNMRNLPASRCHAADMQHTLVSEGCFIGHGARLERAIIGQRGRVGTGSILRDTVMCGSDYYETHELTESSEDSDRDTLVASREPMGVGANCFIEQAVLDKDCRIGANVAIYARGRPDTFDGDHYYIRDGIVVIPKGATVPAGTIIGEPSLPGR